MPVDFGVLGKNDELTRLINFIPFVSAEDQEELVLVENLVYYWLVSLVLGLCELSFQCSQAIEGKDLQLTGKAVDIERLNYSFQVGLFK